MSQRGGRRRNLEDIKNLKRKNERREGKEKENENENENENEENEKGRRSKEVSGVIAFESNCGQKE